MKRFQEVTAQLEQALGGISFDELDISDEVREQVWLSSIALRFSILKHKFLPILFSSARAHNLAIHQ